MDKRILHSEQALKASFIYLMHRKSPETITVRELCAEAGLNRSTFYERYGHIDRLAEAVIRDSVDEVCTVLTSLFPEDTIRKGDGVDPVVILSYIRRFQSNKNLLRFCSCQNTERYRTMIVQHQIRISMQEENRSVRYFLALFQNAGVLYLMMEWIRLGRPVSEKTIVDIIHRFSKAMYE